ncbi:MAG: YlmC/YmxH family sporulation protein [Peptococcaceae bacterium]|jgi:YlmC/YmxH family sporulation protein|nr:YlmC/YmxH family sporulation protein [Peptococcaceae bacterium]
MRLGHLSGKEIINLYDGTRLGVIAQPDAVVDGPSGAVRLIVVAGGLRLLGRGPRSLGIPWEAVRKIGREVVVVDLAPGQAGNTLKPVPNKAGGGL